MAQSLPPGFPVDASKLIPLLWDPTTNIYYELHQHHPVRSAVRPQPAYAINPTHSTYPTNTGMSNTAVAPAPFQNSGWPEATRPLVSHFSTRPSIEPSSRNLFDDPTLPSNESPMRKSGKLFAEKRVPPSNGNIELIDLDLEDDKDDVVKPLTPALKPTKPQPKPMKDAGRPTKILEPLTEVERKSDQSLHRKRRLSESRKSFFDEFSIFPTHRPETKNSESELEPKRPKEAEDSNPESSVEESATELKIATQEANLEPFAEPSNPIVEAVRATIEPDATEVEEPPELSQPTEAFQAAIEPTEETSAPPIEPEPPAGLQNSAPEAFTDPTEPTENSEKAPTELSDKADEGIENENVDAMPMPAIEAEVPAEEEDSPELNNDAMKCETTPVETVQGKESIETRTEGKEEISEPIKEEESVLSQHLDPDLAKELAATTHPSVLAAIKANPFKSGNSPKPIQPAKLTSEGKSTPKSSKLRSQEKAGSAAKTSVQTPDPASKPNGSIVLSRPQILGDLGTPQKSAPISPCPLASQQESEPDFFDEWETYLKSVFENVKTASGNSLVICRYGSECSHREERRSLTLKAVESHVLSHQDTKPFLCTFCSVFVKDREAHRATHSDEEAHKNATFTLTEDSKYELVSVIDKCFVRKADTAQLCRPEMISPQKNGGSLPKRKFDSAAPKMPKVLAGKPRKYPMTEKKKSGPSRVSQELLKRSKVTEDISPGHMEIESRERMTQSLMMKRVPKNAKPAHVAESMGSKTMGKNRGNDDRDRTPGKPMELYGKLLKKIESSSPAGPSTRALNDLKQMPKSKPAGADVRPSRESTELEKQQHRDEKFRGLDEKITGRSSMSPAQRKEAVRMNRNAVASTPQPPRKTDFDLDTSRTSASRRKSSRRTMPHSMRYARDSSDDEDHSDFDTSSRYARSSQSYRSKKNSGSSRKSEKYAQPHRSSGGHAINHPSVSELLFDRRGPHLPNDYLNKLDFYSKKLSGLVSSRKVPCKFSGCEKLFDSASQVHKTPLEGHVQKHLAATFYQCKVCSLKMKNIHAHFQSMQKSKSSTKAAEHVWESMRYNDFRKHDEARMIATLNKMFPFLARECREEEEQDSEQDGSTEESGNEEARETAETPVKRQPVRKARQQGAAVEPKQNDVSPAKLVELTPISAQHVQKTTAKSSRNLGRPLPRPTTKQVPSRKVDTVRDTRQSPLKRLIGMPNYTKRSTLPGQMDTSDSAESDVTDEDDLSENEGGVPADEMMEVGQN